MALAECNSEKTTAHHGGAYSRPFWNANATQFTYVPAFHFPVSPMATEYLFTATDCEGNRHSFRDKKPTALLTPIWADIPSGMVTLTVEALSAEGKAMMNLLTGNNCYNITMCIEGKQLSSTELAEKTEKISVDGKSTLNIVIGSSFGIADEIKAMSDFKLSMSKMTFPHQLARVMVLEQLYRAFQINSGGKYHK